MDTVTLSDEHLMFLYGFAEGLGLYPARGSLSVHGSTNGCRYHDGKAAGQRLNTPIIMAETGPSTRDLEALVQNQARKIAELEERLEAFSLTRSNERYGSF